MFNDPFHWFPDPYFSTILFIFVVGVYIIDYYIPKLFVPSQPGKPVVVQDRFSFYVIQAVGIASIIVAMACRYMDWTITPAAMQYFGLLCVNGRSSNWVVSSRGQCKLNPATGLLLTARTTGSGIPRIQGWSSSTLG
jgi:hypothetical protein